MKVHFVTGATGFVGRYLTEALLKEGETVWIAVRSPARAASVFGDSLRQWPETLRIVAGDILQSDFGLAQSVLRELEQQEVVIWHLAANLSFAAKDQAEVQRTNYGGTVNAVTFANRYGAQLMHMSTAYVCGDAQSLREDELDKGQRFRNQYESSKFQAEAYVHSQSQIPYLVFRPSIIIGDTYRGKAEGCTFGYYRYMYMLHFLKQQIVKALEQKKLPGASYDRTGDRLTVPWLVIPYPRQARVDMVTVNYVVESMIRLYQQERRGRTVHLTQPDLPRFHFLFEAVLQDLGYRKVKLMPVPAWAFRGLLHLLHAIAKPVRKYVRSVMWYTPYITRRYDFERSAAKHDLPVPPVISRALVTKINTYAKEEILDHIKV